MKKRLDFKNFSIYFDQYLFIAITLLSVMGLFFLYSASQEDITIVAKQAVFVSFGLFLMFMVSQLDPDFYKTYSGVFLVISILLIFATTLFGKEINGAKRWLDLGLFTLQTSEIIKISLPIFLSSYLYNKSLPISSKHTFITLILIGFIFASFSIAMTNGGIGSYPEAIVIAFTLFNLPEDPSRAFGWIMWTSQTIMVIVLGGLSLFFLPIYNKVFPKQTSE